jgi:hypothetical protein
VIERVAGTVPRPVGAGLRLPDGPVDASFDPAHASPLELVGQRVRQRLDLVIAVHPIAEVVQHGVHLP